MFSCPSQSAITEVSMPARSNRIAAECRKTCIVTDFCISIGQTPPAICTYLASLCSRASRLSALPEHVTKRGAPGRPARSASQTRRVVTRPDVSGVIRCFRPFPLQLTCAPAARWTSAHRRPISSDARRPVWLIFNSWRSQAIDRMRKNALRRGRGTTLRSFGVGSDVRDLAQGRWQGDAEGGEREGGGGTRGGAQQEALAVLFDLGLGERVEIGDDVGPGGAGAGAGAGEAVFQLLLQNEGEEAAGDVAADRLIQFVIDRPRLEQTLGRAERPLHGPQLFVDEHRLERREMRIGLQHEHAVELGVLLDLGAVDEEAVALRVGEETAVAFVADEALVALLQLPQGGD